MLIFYCQHNPLWYIFLLQMWNRNFRMNSRQQVVSLFRASCVSPVELIDRRGGRGWARSQIIRTQESLVLYKSFNTHWFLASCHSWNTKASLPCLEGKICNKYTDFLVKKVRYGSGTTIPNPDPTQPISSGSYRIRIYASRFRNAISLTPYLPFPVSVRPRPRFDKHGVKHLLHALHGDCLSAC
jgi:hypothetical protein